MKKLISVFWEICLLRLGPQDLPYSPFLLGLTLGAYVLSGMSLLAVRSPLPTVLVTVITEAVLLSVFVYIALWMRLYTARFVQTLSALAGAGTLFNLIAFLPLVWQHALGAEAQRTLTLPSVLLLTTLLWNIIVTAHILRHALSAWMIFSMAIALLYSFISIRIVDSIMKAVT